MSDRSPTGRREGWPAGAAALVLVIGTLAVVLLGVAGVVTVRMLRHDAVTATAPHRGGTSGSDAHAAGGMGTGGPSVPPPATAIAVEPTTLTNALEQAGADCYRLAHQAGVVCYRALSRHATTEVAFALAPPRRHSGSAGVGAVVASTDAADLDPAESKRFRVLVDRLAQTLLGRQADVLVGRTGDVHTDAAGLVVSAQFDRGRAAIRAPRFAGPDGSPATRLPRSPASIAADLGRDGWTCAAACRTGHGSTTAFALIHAGDVQLSFQHGLPAARFVRRAVGDLLHAAFPAAEPATVGRLTAAAAGGREQVAVLADMQVRVSGTGAGTRVGIRPVQLPA